MLDTLITGGIVVNASGERPANVVVSNGRITALLEPGISTPAHRIIDATGMYLLPGLVDAHAHLREPGLTHKEDFGSGTHAAALGGVTTVLDMPTDEPWTVTPADLAHKTSLAKGRIHVDVGFQLAVKQAGTELTAFAGTKPVSFELFTADVPEAFLFDTMERVARALAGFAGSPYVVGVSPGDQSMLSGCLLREDGLDAAAFGRSRPPLAEANGVARAVLAAASTGASIHVRQVNSALGIATWRRLRDIADATVETTVQNLFFTADDYGVQGARLKGSPPLRARADVEELRAALRDGLIDIVATDHAPHTPAEKAAVQHAFADIPGGMPGLQTLLAAMLKLVEERLIGLSDLARMCARNPAIRFGLGSSKGIIAPGFDADILILDPRGQMRLSDSAQVSRAGYTPFDGWSVPWRLAAVLLRGEEIARDGALIGAGRGRVISRET